MRCVSHTGYFAHGNSKGEGPLKEEVGVDKNNS